MDSSIIRNARHCGKTAAAAQPIAAAILLIVRSTEVPLASAMPVAMAAAMAAMVMPAEVTVVMRAAAMAEAEVAAVAVAGVVAIDARLRDAMTT
jgi:hypothetical protein